MGNGVQTGAVHFLHGNVAFLGHLHNLPGGAAELAPGHQKLFDVPAALEGLPDGIAAAEQILVGYHVRLGLHGRGGLIGRGCGIAELVVAAFLAAAAGLALLVVGGGGHVAAPFLVARCVFGEAVFALLGLGAELAAFAAAFAPVAVKAALLPGTGAAVTLAGLRAVIAAIRLAVVIPMVAVGLAFAVEPALVGAGTVVVALALSVPAAACFAEAVFAGVVAALVVKAAPILGHGLFFPAGLSFYVFIKCHVVSCFLFGSFHFVSGDSGFC